MTCERCYKPEDIGEHGLGLCPLERRRAGFVVWQDTIEGGVMMANAICNPDGTPKRYDSRTEIRDACKAKGIIPWTDAYSDNGGGVAEGRVYNDWLKSGEAQRAKRDRDEARSEKYLKRDREAARAR